MYIVWNTADSTAVRSGGMLNKLYIKKAYRLRNIHVVLLEGFMSYGLK
jgi:hypothetical protein